MGRMVLTTNQHTAFLQKLDKFRHDFSSSETLIQNYLNKLKGDNIYAEQLSDYLKELNTVFRYFESPQLFEKEAEKIELKETLLMDFFNYINFANIDSEENTLLSGYFHGLNDLFSNYKTLEMNKKNAVRKNQQYAIDILKSESDSLFDSITEECRSLVGIEIYDENIPETNSAGINTVRTNTPLTLNNNIGKAIGNVESLIEEDNKKAKEFEEKYFLGSDDGKEKLKRKYISIKSDVEEKERNLENIDFLGTKKNEAAFLEEYINSGEFKRFEKKNTSELDDLREKFNAAEKNLQEVENALDNEETRSKLDAYNSYKDAYKNIDGPLRGRIREYLRLSKLLEEVTVIVNQEDMKRKGLLDRNTNIILSPELLKLRDEKQLFIDDMAGYLAAEMQNVIAGHEQEVIENTECFRYMNDPANENYIASIRELESAKRKLQTERQNAFEKFTEKKQEIIKDKKEFASKIPFGFSDEETDKLSYSDIAGMYRDNLKKIKAEVEKIYESDSYKKAKEDIEKTKKEAEEYFPDKHIKEFEDFDREKKSHIERKKKYEQLSRSLSALMTKNEEISNKQSFLNRQGELLKANYAESKIAKLLTDYDKAIDNNARKGITLDNDKSELKEEYLKNNSAEFVQMRLALRKAKELFAEGSTASKEDKINYLEALKDFSNDYVKAREAEFRPFASSTRKYRIAFAKELAMFAEAAFNDMIAENSTPELEENAPVQEEKTEELINDIKEEPEVSASQKFEEYKQQRLSKDEKKLEEAARKEVTDKIDEQLRQIIPNDAQDICMRDSSLKISLEDGSDKTVSQPVFAAYIALKTLRTAAEKVPAQNISALFNKKDLELLTDSIQASKAFTDVMLKMDADSRGKDFMLKTESFGELTNKLASDCIAERSAKKTKQDYIDSAKRRMNNIYPEKFAGRLKLSVDSIAKYIYLSTVLNEQQKFTKEQLGALLSESEIEKQTEYIKEKPKFIEMIENIPNSPFTKDGIGSMFLKAAAESYKSGRMSTGAKEHPDEITSQIENLSNQTKTRTVQNNGSMTAFK